MNFFGAGIFWTTVAVAIGTLSIATIFGRAWAELLPFRLRGPARFYLAPAMGLATLTVFASAMGRLVPLGDSVLPPILITTGLIKVLLREDRPGDALRQALFVSCFGLVCGVSMLGALFVFGAFNVGNDAFTYLAHSNWLQHNAFRQTISNTMVDPLGTQVFLYQQGGFRMGASFLLALMQGLLNLRWSTEVYPGVMIAAITACCISIGFPIARWLRAMPRFMRLGLLALPAFSTGGLIFGASQGFLPQTFGLSFGSAFLFLIGPLFRWVAGSGKNPEPSKKILAKATLPSVFLLSASVLSYSELSPFLLMATLGSGFLLVIKHREWRKLTGIILILLLFTAVILNFEMVRAYKALSLQTGVVVGVPTNWGLLGFLAHAMGMHGGVWDYFQWNLPQNVERISIILGTSLLVVTFLILLSSKKTLTASIASGYLLPVISILMVFASGFLYFRYFVPSPFPVGKGQSWSQFKLTEWAHPFVMAVLILAIAHLRSSLNRSFNRLVIVLLIIGTTGTFYVSIIRITPFMSSYNGIKDMNQFYLDFRERVNAICSSDASIYLNLGNSNHKFRQMAALYLPDRNIKANWSDDGYIGPYLPEERRSESPQKKDCVVEPISTEGLAQKSISVGPFQIGTFNDLPRIRIVSVVNSHDRESDGKNWWYWVEKKISFQFKSVAISELTTRTKFAFQYQTRTNQYLKFDIITVDDSVTTLILSSKENQLTEFEQVIEIPPVMIKEIRIDTGAVATPLGKNDTRLAAWSIRNVQVIPVQQ